MDGATTFRITQPLREGETLAHEVDTKADAYIQFGHAISDVKRREIHGRVTLERVALGTSAEMARVVL